MTAACLSPQPSGNMVAVWVLVCAFPLLIAAELTQQSNPSTHLSLPDNYRSKFSDQVLKSSKWRHPSQDSSDWRAPASPKIEWRTDPARGPQQTESLQNLELYPNYRPGEPSTFDLSTPEDKSFIKVFEFDFGR